MVFACGGIGLPIAELLPPRFVWRPLLAPTLGYAVLAVAVTVSYRWGVPIRLFFFKCGLACDLARRAPASCVRGRRPGVGRRATKRRRRLERPADAGAAVGWRRSVRRVSGQPLIRRPASSRPLSTRESHADVVGASRTQIQKYPLIISARASRTPTVGASALCGVQPGGNSRPTGSTMRFSSSRSHSSCSSRCVCCARCSPASR
jgi:hypothetical protein